MRVRWSTATLFALVAVFACTLFPFHFHIRERPFRSVWEVLLIPIGPDIAPDVLENVVLFMPLGFTMTGYFRHRGIETLSVVARVLLLSLGVSYSIEVLQRFMPGRFTSLTDVISNTAGAGLGVLCHSAWHRMDK